MNLPSPQTCYMYDLGLVAYLRGWPDVWLHIEGEGKIEIFT